MSAHAHGVSYKGIIWSQRREKSAGLLCGHKGVLKINKWIEVLELNLLPELAPIY